VGLGLEGGGREEENGGIISKCVPASSTCNLLTTCDEQAGFWALGIHTSDT
jgi:hypothetical protein